MHRGKVNDGGHGLGMVVMGDPCVALDDHPGKTKVRLRCREGALMVFLVVHSQGSRCQGNASW